MPVILIGWIGKLPMKSTVEGTEDVIVGWFFQVRTVVACYNDVFNHKN